MNTATKNDLSVFFNKIYFTMEDKNSNQFIIDLSRTYVAKILRTFFLYNEKRISFLNSSQQKMDSL